MALEFVGMIDGKATVFTPEQLGQWILDKSNRVIQPKNAKKCAEYLMAHDGSGGGISTTNKLDGKHSIFHISHGKRNGDNGCSLFFSTRENKHAVVVGIGWHFKSDTVYKLDYKNGNWNQAGRMIVTL